MQLIYSVVLCAMKAVQLKIAIKAESRLHPVRLQRSGSKLNTSMMTMTMMVIEMAGKGIVEIGAES